MKRFVDGVDRSQGLLLPDRLEDYVHEDINRPYRVVIVDEVFQSIREQKPLGTINAIHESLHVEHPSTGAQIMPVEAWFSHSLDPKRTSSGVYRHSPPEHVIFSSRIDHGGLDRVAHPRRFLLSTELIKFLVERCLDCFQNR